MTFDKQVKEAKAKKLENRLIRDIVFVILGIVFLIISITASYIDNKKEEKNSNMNNVTTKKIKKTTTK